MGGLDLCGLVYNNGIYHTEITFDITTGILIFDTDDHETFPDGNYNFQITITIGVVVQTIDIVIILHPACANVDLTIINQPQLTTYYILGADMQAIFTYDINTLV